MYRSCTLPAHYTLNWIIRWDLHLHFTCILTKNASIINCHFPNLIWSTISIYRFTRHLSMIMLKYQIQQNFSFFSISVSETMPHSITRTILWTALAFNTLLLHIKVTLHCLTHPIILITKQQHSHINWQLRFYMMMVVSCNHPICYIMPHPSKPCKNSNITQP